MDSVKEKRGSNILLVGIGSSEQLNCACQVFAGTEWSEATLMLCHKDTATAPENEIAEIIDSAGVPEMMVVLIAPGEHPALEQALSLTSAAKERGIPSVILLAKELSKTEDFLSKIFSDTEKLLENADSIVLVPSNKAHANQDAALSDEPQKHFYQNTLAFLSLLDSAAKEKGFIYFDLMDIKFVLKNAGFVYMGAGYATGEYKAERVAEIVCSDFARNGSPVTAQRVLVQITGSMNIGLNDVDAIVSQIQENVHPEATVIFGADFDEHLEDGIRVVVLAA